MRGKREAINTTIVLTINTSFNTVSVTNRIPTDCIIPVNEAELAHHVSYTH